MENREFNVPQRQIRVGVSIDRRFNQLSTVEATLALQLVVSVTWSGVIQLEQ
jgi:hypothetical protein